MGAKVMARAGLAKRAAGFSLIEMAVVLAVLAMVASAALVVGAAQSEANKREETQQKLTTISAMLERFALRAGYIPCPARRTDAPTSATFGLSTDCTAAAPAGTTDVATTGGHADGRDNLRIGVIPSRSLSLSDAYMYDAWGNKFTYAVIKELAINGYKFSQYAVSTGKPTTLTDGVLQVRDSAPNNIVSDATTTTVIAFIVISHGKDGKGATDKVGNTKACTAGYKDTENCDNDEEFIDTRINEISAAGFFDDFVVWKEKHHLVSLYD